MNSPVPTTSPDHDAAKRAQAAIRRHQSVLSHCRRCPDMIPPVVMGEPVASPVILIGQAPGAKEGPAGRPFAWTAGKTLFRWFETLGLDERRFRSRVYMAAVCRCFPGKKPKGGDRVPTEPEVTNCSRWLRAEFELLAPQLVIPVGKLAIAQLMPVPRLNVVVGQCHRLEVAGRSTDVVPLPHPSGASTWHRTDSGKGLLADALALIGEHPAWRSLL